VAARAARIQHRPPYNSNEGAQYHQLIVNRVEIMVFSSGDSRVLDEFADLAQEEIIDCSTAIGYLF